MRPHDYIIDRDLYIYITHIVKLIVSVIVVRPQETVVRMPMGHAVCQGSALTVTMLIECSFAPSIEKSSTTKVSRAFHSETDNGRDNHLRHRKAEK